MSRTGNPAESPCSIAKDKFVGYLGGPGTDPGQFSEVDTLVIDSAGQLVVLDFGNRRIQVFALAEPSGGTPVAAVR